MIDPELLRSDSDRIKVALSWRGVDLDLAEFNQIDQQRRSTQQQVEALRAERNKGAKQVGVLLRDGNQAEAEKLKAKSVEFAVKLTKLEGEMQQLQQQEQDILLQLPNVPDPEVPAGLDETNNLEIRTHGKLPEFDFDPRDHVALGSSHQEMDFETASAMARSRFVVLSGQIAKLHRALTQFMLDFHIKQHGYTEYYLPYLVNEQALTNSGQLPKFGDQVFMAREDPLYLIPTAEVPLVNLFATKLLDPNQLPLKLVAHTPSFRREAGSYGRDTRGMLRQHQFDKVELVQITEPEDSEKALAEIVEHAEQILQLLELPYQVCLLCAGDMGFSAAKTYDLEVWLPGQSAYREISSCSNCTDFQARRMGGRVRNQNGKGSHLVHTLNGSGVAVGRALIAVMENGQQSDGSIIIPAALQPYLDGQKLITVTNP